MKNLFRNIFVFSILFTLSAAFQFTFASDSNYTIAEPYNYTELTTSDVWFNTDTHQGRRELSQLDMEIAKNMTTEALVETVIQYPLFPSPLWFDDPTTVLDNVMDYNGFIELFSRKDAGTVLMEKYREYLFTVPNISDYTSHNIMCNTEVLLGQHRILDMLTDDEMIDLGALVMDVYDKKTENDYPIIARNMFFKTLQLNVKEASQKLKLEVIQIQNTKYQSEELRIFNDFSILGDATDLDIAELDVAELDLFNNDPFTYIYTKTNRIRVTVYMRGEQLTPEQKSNQYNQILQQFPNVTILGPATTKYNCHSYTFYNQSTNNTYWLADPIDFLNDDWREIRTGVPMTDDILVYGNRAHSAICIRYNIDMNKSRFVSKWGESCLVQHTPYETPYTTATRAYDNY